MMANKLSERRYLDSQGCEIFTVSLYYHRGTVSAQYQNGFYGSARDTLFHINPGQYPNQGAMLENIHKLAQEHFSDIRQTLHQFSGETPSKKRRAIWTALNDGAFSKLRTSFRQKRLKRSGKLEENNQREKGARFSQFIDAIRNRMKNDFFIHENAFNREINPGTSWPEKQWEPIQKVGTKYVIVDRQISLTTSLALLLLSKPYSKIPKPSLEQIFKEHSLSHQLRTESLDSLLEGLSLVAKDGTLVSDYTLTLDGKTVYEKKGREISILDPSAVSTLLSPIKFNEHHRVYHSRITESLIDNLMRTGVIMPFQAEKLKRFIGKSFHQAIHYHTTTYGNRARISEISDEIKSLGPADSYLYETVKFFYTKDKSEDMWWPPTPERTDWGAQIALIEKGYEDDPLTWNLIHQVIDYLDEKTTLEELTINDETAPIILKICKMCDYAAAQLNCLRGRDKYKHSTYFLRKTLCERWPELQTGEAFTRKIRYDGVGKLKVEEHGKNWCPGRAGQHAKAVANQHIKSSATSEKLEKIVAGRGNTGAGKSTGLGKDPGILNTDPIKWELRRGTDIRNSQVHPEGAMLFDYYFDEMSQKRDFRFTVDLRLIDVEALNTYVLEPARKRGSPVKLADFDVPLITSLNRVLTRNPRGEDPCPPEGPIVSGFLGVRRHRAEVICEIMNESLVEEFHLYYLGRLVAKKENDELTIENQELFEKTLKQPTEEEVETTLQRKIDDTYIEEAIERGDIYRHQKEKLENWKGLTVQEAIKGQSQI